MSIFLVLAVTLGGGKDPGSESLVGRGRADCCEVGDADLPNDVLEERKTPFTRPTGRMVEFATEDEHVFYDEKTVAGVDPDQLVSPKAYREKMRKLALSRFHAAVEQCRAMGECDDDTTATRTFQTVRS